MSAATELHVALSLRLDAVEAYRLANNYHAETLRNEASNLRRVEREGVPEGALGTKTGLLKAALILDERADVAGQKATATPAATATPTASVFDPLPGYLHAIGQAATQYERDLYAAYRQAIAEVARLQAEIAEEATPELTVYRAEHPDSGITLGHYGTPAAARKHCEETERRSWPKGTNLVFDWIEDDEDRVAELVVVAGQNEESTTGYLVTALEIPSEYDAEAAE